MKILHIASFSGNIGDHLNHEGLYSVLNNCLKSITIEKEEIRRYYFNCQELSFNEDFLKRANEFDLIIFGGGNFFDIQWENSSTGCTFDIPKEIIERIKPPMLFYGLGFDIHKGYSPKTVKSFYDFIMNLNKKQVLVTVRNDGSFQNLKAVFSKLELEEMNIKEVNDGAFFFEKTTTKTGNYVAVNFANDMPEKRFTNASQEQFIEDMAVLLKKVNLPIVIVPHINSDIDFSQEILDYAGITDYEILEISDPDSYFSKITETYGGSKFNICMRFHSNILSTILGKDMLPIITYVNVKSMFDSINVGVKYFDYNSENFCQINEQNAHKQKIDMLAIDSLKENTSNLIMDFICKTK